ncbi:GlxA family transcriptional regulator [Pseudomonas citronellolis]|uniref:GlxA family transcriptional regulator n=1 Tax=Pseudomonas citronellolis TaxID=53408 RepID=UPI0021C200F7|nr:helix-turn-helix domain-containing protein [Pseudomonas citronellolis]UXJ50243.1 helix-turn-helix domain-containing protein [Pseudomonas citronellolis]
MAGFAVIGLADAYISSLGIFLDTFELIRRQVIALYRTREPMAMQTQVHLLTPNGRPVRMAGGRNLSADGGLDNHVQYDLIYLPSFLVGDEASLDARLAEATPLCRWLAQQYASGARVSASGPAVFLLAESGLLNGGTAAIGRLLVPLFRRRYPNIQVDQRAAVVEHGRVVTGSGLAADAQLLARLVEQVTTPELARWLGDVTSLHQATEDRLADDPLTANAQLWLEERFAQEVRVTDLAKAMSVSQQTLLRHFHRHLKISPQEYIRQVRMKSAQGLLLRTSRPIGQIASLVGYSDAHTFRKVFRTYTGISASKYRALKKNTDNNQDPSEELPSM